MVGTTTCASSGVLRPEGDESYCSSDEESMAARTLKERWKAGEVTLGAWCVMPGAMGPEVVARQGFDWVMIDMQHGCIEYGDALAMIRAVDQTPAAPIVRVPWNEPSVIGRVLDAGALGVLVPMIQTAEDARKAVEGARSSSGRSISRSRSVSRPETTTESRSSTKRSSGSRLPPNAPQSPQPCSRIRVSHRSGYNRASR